MGKDNVGFSGCLLLKSSLGGFLANCYRFLSCRTVSLKTAESETDARPRSARAGRAMWGPGRLIFYLKTGRPVDNRIGVSPLGPVLYSRGKHWSHRSRRSERDSGLHSRFSLRAITAPGPAAESVRSGRKHQPSHLRAHTAVLLSMPPSLSYRFLFADSPAMKTL